MRQLGVGISVFQALESFIGANGGNAPNISRYVDLSVGHAWKDIVVDFAPGFIGVGGTSARANTTEKDRGALLRVTPYGSNRKGAERGSPVRLDLAGAFSQRNYGRQELVYINVSQSDPIIEDRRVGAAARVTLRLPTSSDGVWRVLTPEIGLGAAWEQSRFYDGDVRVGSRAINRTGQEITILGLVSLRHGFVDDPSGWIQDDSWGVGAALQYRGMFGARYDWAQIPQASFLQEVKRHGFSVFIDPYRMWQAAHKEPEYH